MKKSKHECDLHSCFLCRHSLKEWLPVLQLNRKTYTVPRGGRLFSEGDAVQGIYFLEKGRVKVHQRWTDDKELILRFAGAGAIVGHRGMGKELVYPISATALEPSSVCFIEMEFFYTTLKLNNDLLFRLLLFFADELKESEQRMRNISSLPVKSRIALALLTLEEKFGTTAEGFLDLVLSRQDLAAYVGATYETVFRMLQELMSEGLIILSGKNISLVNRTALLAATDNTRKALG